MGRRGSNEGRRWFRRPAMGGGPGRRRTPYLRRGQVEALVIAGGEHETDAAQPGRHVAAVTVEDHGAREEMRAADAAEGLLVVGSFFLFLPDPPVLPGSLDLTKRVKRGRRGVVLRGRPGPGLVVCGTGLCRSFPGGVRRLGVWFGLVGCRLPSWGSWRPWRRANLLVRGSGRCSGAYADDPVHCVDVELLRPGRVELEAVEADYQALVRAFAGGEPQGVRAAPFADDDVRPVDQVLAAFLVVGRWPVVYADLHVGAGTQVVEQAGAEFEVVTCHSDAKRTLFDR